jgi:hypothetical protein
MNRHERRAGQRRIKPLKRRRFTFNDEMLDEFEACEAMRIAGADSYEAVMAGTPERYAFRDRSLDLQLQLLHLPFTGAACGGIFDVEPPQADDNPMLDREFFLDVRRQLLAAVEERKRRRGEQNHDA